VKARFKLDTLPIVNRYRPIMGQMVGLSVEV